MSSTEQNNAGALADSNDSQNFQSRQSNSDLVYRLNGTHSTRYGESEVTQPQDNDKQVSVEVSKNVDQERMDTIRSMVGEDSEESADEEDYTMNLKLQKSELVLEVEEDDRKRKCCAACSVITRYLYVEQSKKQRAMKIGIFTIFLVVMIITMLKSVVDSAPIIFVKMGQDQVGTIDYTITSPNGGNYIMNGNVNWYNIDPFHNPLNYSQQPYTLTQEEQILYGIKTKKQVSSNNPQKLAESLDMTLKQDDPPPEPQWLAENTQVYNDRIQFESSFSLIRTHAFYEHLNTLNDTFAGFFPRWVLPGTVMKASSDSNITSTQTMISIDSVQENYVGVGNSFPAVVLEDNEMLIPTEVANFLGKKKGDTALLQLGLTNVFGQDALFKLIDKMMSDKRSFKFDFDSKLIHTEDQEPLDWTKLGISQDPFIELTIADTYDSPDAKYSVAWGNVAFLDGKYVLNEWFDAILKEIQPLFILNHKLWKEIHDEVVSYQDYFNYYEINLCTTALQLDGELLDEAKYYLKTYNNIHGDILKQGEKITNALGLMSNATMTIPLSKQFQRTDRMKDFLDSTLLTVIVFLGMLSAMLLYSLMLSDVDEKTYEYGMLRSLGFKKSYLMRMILMQSSAFSIPGIIFGVLVAFIANVLLREVIFVYSQNYMTYNLTKWSLILGISFGVIMPHRLCAYILNCPTSIKI